MVVALYSFDKVEHDNIDKITSFMAPNVLKKLSGRNLSIFKADYAFSYAFSSI